MQSWVDPRGNGAKIGRGVDEISKKKLKIKNLNNSARQGEFNSEKNRHAPNPNGAMDGNSGGCKGSEVMR
jgi:hypothetical protein